jgi:L-fuculokinase
MTAIFDIGKTNKKLFVFDDELKIVYEQSQHFTEIKDEDGFPCEDWESLTEWMKSSLNKLFLNPSFNIKKVNFSGYGASFVHLGRDGKPATPLYNYLKPFPRKLSEKFQQTYGPVMAIAQETASPILGNLNSGMQLYWLKYDRPEIYEKIAISLHLPQYLSSIFTGHYLSDITSIGCHTQLWDFQKNTYHTWVVEEKVDQALAPISHGDLLLPANIQDKSIECGIGVHDSSAALIPYLKNFNEPFLLISTGTWCISLNPFNHEPLTAGELKHDCLCYLNYQGKPVKASRLFSGHEHDIQIKKLATCFNKSENYYSTVKFNTALINNKAYNGENLNDYKTFEEAYHALIDSLVKVQIHSTQLVIGRKQVQSIFVDGGFSKNEIFMNLLARGFPNQKVFSSDIAQASALGAALVINAEIEKNLSKNFTLRQFGAL